MIFVSETTKKVKLLKQNLAKMNKVLIAFSGGVDSTYLLTIAQEVLGEHVAAITARSPAFPERELEGAVAFCEQHGIKQVIIQSGELEDSEFRKNPPHRCYLCKKQLFVKIRNIADELAFPYIAEGSNLDDLADYRPGRQALSELEIQSPLLKAGLTKDEIRSLSKELNLPTWDKPSYACLASRFPYGEEITKEKLTMVEEAEQILRDLGFKQIRVRHHGDVARIEVAWEDRFKILESGIAEIIYEAFAKLGFTYSALDLKGYRSGSMNEKILTHLALK